jgi:diacylglycerol kinase (ATP)
MLAEILEGGQKGELRMNGNADRAAERQVRPTYGNRRQSALPGRGGLSRIAGAVLNSIRGLREGLLTEAAVKQEIAIAVVLLPVSFFVAGSVWVWLALVASVLFVLVVEFLNTAVERLCNHVTPEHHEAIRVTKDLASTAVFFSLCLAGLVWIVALLDRLSLIG